MLLTRCLLIASLGAALNIPAPGKVASYSDHASVAPALTTELAQESQANLSPRATHRSSASALSASDEVIEPGSKVRFATKLTVQHPKEDAKPREHTLLGVGLRTKTWFKVKVYAVGLYGEEAAVRKELAAWKGKSKNKLKDNRKFYSALIEGKFGKTLRLVMARDVDSEDMVEAFDEVLKPGIERYQKARKVSGGKQALKLFRKQFNLKELKKGTELVFTWHPDGTLTTRVGGVDKGSLKSAPLCWAMFDAFLGKDPISESAKQTLIARIPALLRADS